MILKNYPCFRILILHLIGHIHATMSCTKFEKLRWDDCICATVDIRLAPHVCAQYSIGECMYDSIESFLYCMITATTTTTIINN